jgi:uncharacterized membrane protein
MISTIMPRRAAAVLRIGVVLLVLLGVFAALCRALYPADFAVRSEPVREDILRFFGRDDPLMARRPADLQAFDRPFAEHRVMTYLHVVPGAAFLLLAPLQFVSRLRNRHLAFHRSMGRILILSGLATAVPAFFFGLLTPYGGAAEAVIIAAYGALFVLSLMRAWIAIRRRRIDAHREWMIRAFGVAIGISVVRVVGALLDVATAPYGPSPPAMLVLALGLGFSLAAGFAELWIRRTLRPL